VAISEAEADTLLKFSVGGPPFGDGVAGISNIEAATFLGTIPLTTGEAYSAAITGATVADAAQTLTITHSNRSVEIGTATETSVAVSLITGIFLDFYWQGDLRCDWLSAGTEADWEAGHPEVDWTSQVSGSDWVPGLPTRS
jgi:hypothetical protein